MRETTLCYIEKDRKYLMLHRIKKENDVNFDKWIGIGGGIEAGETPLECVIREAKEETGLILKAPLYRGVIDFTCPPYEDEIIHLYTCTAFEGDLISDCDDGVLEWVAFEKIQTLPLWEGDLLFFELLKSNHPFFRLSLAYEKDKLISAVLDGNSLKLQ